MKSLFFTAGMTLLLLSGCGSDTNVEDNTQDPVAVTENLIAMDPSLKISAENIVVFNLEHHGAAVGTEDTATAGTDCYTYLHDKAMQTVLSVDTDNSIGSLFVTNKVTNETTTVLSGETSVPLELSANTDYEVCVTHNGMSDQMQTVFVRFSDTASVASSAIASTDMQPVGYSPDDLKKLLATGNCKECDLSGSDLHRFDMSGADLRGANLNNSYLSGAHLSGANLSGAKLEGANLNSADLYQADLNHANLYEADLSGTNLYEANLQDANLDSANLQDANMIGTNLYGANLHEASLNGAKLSGATWTNGKICADVSVGQCVY